MNEAKKSRKVRSMELMGLMNQFTCRGIISPLEARKFALDYMNGYDEDLYNKILCLSIPDNLGYLRETVNKILDMLEA